MSVAQVTDPGAEPVETPEPGDEPQEAPEPGDEPDEPGKTSEQPTPPVSERELNAAVERLEKEANRHAARVSEIMGEDALTLVKCELCEPAIPGFRWPSEPADDVRDAVRRAIGDTPPEGYKDSPDAAQCGACDGLGRQLTGSKVPEHRTKPCASCNGAGWLDMTRQRTPADAPSNQGGVAPIDEPPPDAIPDVDPFGRRRGDPLFGIFPGYEAGR